MASYNELIALIDAFIKRNGVQAITGQILNGVLKAMVDQVGRGYAIMGVATPSTNPGTPDAPESWFASTPGTYTNFGGLEVADAEFALLSYTPSGEVWTKTTLTEGIQEVSASIDGNVGTPEVTAEYINGSLIFTFSNMKGQTGDAAGFGTVNAMVDENIGIPGVSVNTSGPDTAKNITFAFRNLKGETGVTSVVATVDNTSGAPSCAVSLVGQELHLDFHGLKGAQGDTGVSADFPITIANNLTTDDPTAALSAAQGVVLAGELSQLEAKVTGLIPETVINDSAINASGTIVSMTGAKRTDYIDLTGIKKLYASNPNGTKAEFNVFYDSSKTFITDSRFDIPANASYMEVAIPEGAKYIIVCARQTGVTDLPILYTTNAEILQGEIDALESKKVSIEPQVLTDTQKLQARTNINAADIDVSKVAGEIIYPVIENSAISGAGAIISETGSKRSDYIDLSGLSFLFATNINVANLDYNYFYDKDKVKISYFRIPASALLQAIPIPENAVYCIVSVRTSGQILPSLYAANGVELALTQNAIRKNLGLLRPAIVPGSGINATGVIYSGADVQRTDYIDLTGIKFLYVTNPNAFLCEFNVLYDENKAFIQRMPIQSGAFLQKVEIPTGAKYAIFSVRDDGPMYDIFADGLVGIAVTNTIEAATENVGQVYDLDSLPEYWRTYLSGKIPTILEKDALIGNAGDSFVFVTDVHIPNNSMFSPQLIKRIMARTSVDKVFCGGDMLNIETGDDGKEKAEIQFSQWNKLMYGLDDFFIVGNHDNNNFNGTNSGNAITKSELYGLMLKRLEKFYDIDGKTSYVIDNNSQKIRYIVLDAYDGNYSDTLTWMQEKMTELQSGWKVVIMQHLFWSSGETVSPYGTQLVTAINSIYDEMNCELVAVIVGHTHWDYSIVESTNGYPIIAVNCDSRDAGASGYTRTAGTTGEHSFDVFHIDFTNRKIYATRIGAGEDREFTF